MAAESCDETAAFVRAHTDLSPVAFVPELWLHLATEAFDLWERTEFAWGGVESEPPFWAFAWVGGQALARYLLDHPEQVAGRSVLDVGSGSGVVAIAAAKAGAVDVLATEIDPFACAAIELNADANNTSVRVVAEDMLAVPAPAVVPATDVVTGGDMFYERRLAVRVLELLDRTRNAGASVLIGDPGRAFLPRSRFEALASYDVPDPAQLEDTAIKRTSVYRMTG